MTKIQRHYCLFNDGGGDDDGDGGYDTPLLLLDSTIFYSILSLHVKNDLSNNFLNLQSSW